MKKAIAILLAFAFCISLPIISAATDSAVYDSIPYRESIEGVTAYGYDAIEELTSAQASEKSLPEGYEGKVLALTANSGSAVGITLDIAKDRIAVCDIESITFRVLCTENVREVRITDSAGSDWIMRHDEIKPGEWMDVTLFADGRGFEKGKGISDLQDENGYFKDVNFGFRFRDSQRAVVYIDKMEIIFREPDNAAPVIDYKGDTVINTTEKKLFTADVSAFDEYENREIEVEYIFSEGALDDDGRLVFGTHKCILRAVDSSGNAAEIELTLNVGEGDRTAPTIDWAPDKISAKEGMRPVFNVTAEDDCDEVEVKMVYSDGALDERGRFKSGQHTLTLTAEDLSGNKTEKVIYIFVE